MGRAPCCDKANVKKGPWSPEEDAKLKTYIEQYGTGGNWIALPQKIGLKRCGKSCRLRWLNYLRPNIKHGGFSEEEDTIICNLYISIGSRWSVIAAQLPGRTDNDIKNYWNTRLKKKLLGKRRQSHVNRLNSVAGDQDPKDINSCGEDGPYNSQALSNSAIERLQLHMQLQGLQHPFAFYNNPALWPKLHPLQERLIRNFQSMNHDLLLRSPDLIQQHTPPSPEQLQGHERHKPAAGSTYEPPTLQQDYPTKINNEFQKSVNVLSSSVDGCSVAFNCENMVVSKPAEGSIEQSNNMGGQSIQAAVSSFQAELDDFLLNNKMVGFLPQQEEQMGDIYGTKDSLASWWSNEFDTKSASSHSWDSTSAIQSDEGMFQDYVLGYNLH